MAKAAAVATVREAIEQVAVQTFGATVHEEPIEGAGLTRRVLDDPLTGVSAARLAFDVACARLREYALEARAAGRSWDEIAAVLNLPGDTAESAEIPRAERAFEWLIEGRAPQRDRTRLGWRPTATWVCGSCRARVVDRGPFEFHPDDREQGHTPGCAHRAAALRCWRQAHDDQDDPQNDEQDIDEDQQVEDEQDGSGGGRR